MAPCFCQECCSLPMGPAAAWWAWQLEGAKQKGNGLHANQIQLRQKHPHVCRSRWVWQHNVTAQRNTLQRGRVPATAARPPNAAAWGSRAHPPTQYTKGIKHGISQPPQRMQQGAALGVADKYHQALASKRGPGSACQPAGRLERCDAPRCQAYTSHHPPAQGSASWCACPCPSFDQGSSAH